MSYLALADGTVWPGESVGADGYALGEAVFTTGMSGYQEAVTDPSFEDQLICFTAPMVGNYGVAPERSESATTHARAVLMREARGPEWTVGEHPFRSRSGNSWLLGSTLAGMVRMTLAGGGVAFE